MARNITVLYFCCMARNDPLFNMRIPQSLKDRLKESADAHGRSLTSEAIIRLSRSLDEESAPLVDPARGTAPYSGTRPMLAAGTAMFTDVREAADIPVWTDEEAELVGLWKRLPVEKKGLVLALLKLVA